MFGADYVHISRLRKSGLLQLSLNISQCKLIPCHTHRYQKKNAIFVFMKDNLVNCNRSRKDRKGKRLGMKFEGGWSTASYKRACTLREAPEGYHLFRYKDKGTKDIAHMLDLEDYGVTKKWVIITEISKEVENNAIARLNAYAKQYVPRRTGAAGGSSAGGGSSGRY